MGRPVELWWRKRSWRCDDPDCDAGSFTERDDSLARPRSLLTTRACWWAIGQMRREHASVQGLARQLGTAWRTVWRAIKPLLEALAADESRFDGVTTLGVDEHIWHHTSTKPQDQGGRGPKELTGMVDLTRDAKGKVRARLLDLVPGRTGAAYADWLKARNEAFRAGIGVATLDPFHGYKNAIDDQLEDAVAVLDGFHVIKLGTDAVDQCRRRVQQDIHGHRGRKGDPLYGIRLILRCGAERLTDKQKTRLDKAITTDERHEAVYLAWQCAQQLRSAYTATSLTEGRTIAEKIVATFPTCPIPEIARLGRTLKQWSGRPHSWPTSTPAAPTTAAPRPSTASSSYTAASPAASATATTIGYECCSSVADSTTTPTPSKKSRQWECRSEPHLAARPVIGSVVHAPDVLEFSNHRCAALRCVSVPSHAGDELEEGCGRWDFMWAADCHGGELYPVRQRNAACTDHAAGFRARGLAVLDMGAQAVPSRSGGFAKPSLHTAMGPSGEPAAVRRGDRALPR